VVVSTWYGQLLGGQQGVARRNIPLQQQRRGLMWIRCLDRAAKAAVPNQLTRNRGAQKGSFGGSHTSYPPGKSKCHARRGAYRSSLGKGEMEIVLPFGPCTCVAVSGSVSVSVSGSAFL
jgi:hypothetical protein